MTNNKSMPINANRNWGDVAVDGLWPGLSGGLLMMAYLVGVGLLNGTPPLTIFGYFSPDAGLPPLAGFGAHLAVSAVHGAIFGVLTAAIGPHLGQKLPLWMVGIFYGILLWLVAQLILIPSGLSGLGQILTIHLLVAHILYGGIMGWTLANSR